MTILKQFNQTITNACLLACLLLSATSVYSQSSCVGANPVDTENKCNTGTTNWQIPPGTYAATNRQIEGYASSSSVNKGETIRFFVNVTDGSPTFKMDIYRLGWYGGSGGRLVFSRENIPAYHQLLSQSDPITGFKEYNWTVPTNEVSLNSWTVPTTAVSGVYLVKLRNQSSVNSGYASYISFIVRDDARTSDILFKTADNTWQAYNAYPYNRDCASPTSCSPPTDDPDPTQWGDIYSGKSLYLSVSWGTITANGTKQASEVSFNRPYMYDQNRIDLTAGSFFTYEFNMVKWLENNTIRKESFDVSYCADIDIHNADTTNNRLAAGRHKTLLSVGHDEYWSWKMRDNIEKARDYPTNPYNLAFFSANTAYYQVRYGDSNPRKMIGYKSFATLGPSAGQDPNFTNIDPTDNYLITNEWRNNKDSIQMGTCPSTITNCYKNREQELMGVQTDLNMLFTAPPSVSTCPYTFCGNDDEMVFPASNCPTWMCLGLVANSGGTEYRFGKLVGYEADRTHYPLLSTETPPITVGVSPTFYLGSGSYGGGDVPDNSTNLNSNAVFFVRPNGAKIFSIGSVQFAWGLDSYSPVNESGVMTHENRENSNAKILAQSVIKCLTGQITCQ